MKRFVAVAALCAMFSIAAFAVLVTADRQFGLPLPYSIPVSFAIVSIVAPAVYAVANALRRWRPVAFKARPVAPPPASRLRDAATARRRVEGVVLLDFSNARRMQEQAA
jgi:hypothetical protein